MLRFIATFLVLIYSLIGNCSQLEIERMLIQLPSLKNDTTKVNLLNRISWEFHRSHIELTQYYAERARILAEWIDYDAGLCRSLNLMGVYYYYQSELYEMKRLNELSYSIAIKTKNSIGERNALNDLGVFYQEIGEFETALNLLHKSLEISEVLKDDEITCYALFNIYSLYQALGESQRADFYFNQIKNLASDSNPITTKIVVHESLANHYFETKEMQQASSNYQKLYLLAVEADDQISKGIASIGLAKVQYYRGHQELAMIQLKGALKIFEEYKQIKPLMEVKVEIADILLQSGESKIVVRQLNELLNEYGDLIPKGSLPKIYNLLSKAHAKMFAYDKALEASQLHKKYHDELYNIKSARQLAIFETKHKTQLELLENRLLKIQNRKTEAQLKQRVFIFVGSLILFALSFLALYLLKRMASNQNERKTILSEMVESRTRELYLSNIQLKQSNEELEKFAYIASHDLKEPLRNIVGFSNLLERRLRKFEMNNQASDEYLNFIQENAKQMYLLIEDVLEFSRVTKDVSAESFVDLNEIISSVLANLSTQIDENNVRISYEDLPIIKCSSTRLFIVIKNLIENGIKYNQSEEVMIKVGGFIKGGEFILQVEDNGIGIEPQYHKKIFQMFERLHSKNEFNGTGLGLTICSKIVQHMGGRLEVSSQVGKGSTFSIILPGEYLNRDQNADQISLINKNNNSPANLVQERI